MLALAKQTQSLGSGAGVAGTAGMDARVLDSPFAVSHASYAVGLPSYPPLYTSPFSALGSVAGHFSFDYSHVHGMNSSVGSHHMPFSIDGILTTSPHHHGSSSNSHSTSAASPGQHSNKGT